jgi:hypothetical protein
MPTRFVTGVGYIRPGLAGANTAQYTFTAGDVTPDVAKGTVWFCSESAVTITNFDGGELGQTIFVKNGEASNVLQHSAGGIYFSSSATNLTMTTNQCLQFVNDGSQWIEVVPRN